VNTPNPDDLPFEDGPYGFDSLDAHMIYVDGPGDTTVRPPRPLLLKLGMALREHIVELEKLAKQSEKQAEPPPEGT
jgi:hypothetical protein